MRMPGDAGHGSRKLLVVIASVVALGTASCARRVELPGRQRGDAGGLTAARFATGPPACALLSIEEVEVAVNAAVAETPGVTRPILAGMSMCALARAASSPGSAPGSQGEMPAVAAWGVLSAQASSAFERYESWHAEHVERLVVSGHEALWDARLRTLVVLADDRALAIRLSAPSPVLGSGQKRGSYFREAAVRLAAAALRRL